MVKIIVYILADFLVTFLSSMSMEPPVMAALTTIATNKDADRVTVKVIGKYFMNLPIVPGHNANGRKAISVVSVEEITGQAISPIPILEASILGLPFFILAKTLSTTTIPSSTSIPSPITNPKRTMVLSVNPNAERILNAINIDNGMAAPTNKEFLSPIVNINTIITSTIPKIMWFDNSSTWCSTREDWSFVNSIFRLDGKYDACASLIFSLTCSIAEIMFWLERFFTFNITTSFPFSRA